MLSTSRKLKLKHNFAKYVDNPFKRFTSSLQSYYGYFKMYGLAEMNDPKVDSLPFCIRIMLENVMRHCDQFQVKSIDVLKVLNWQEASKQRMQIPFKPSRVLLQDFTGLSVIVDLAAMRDAMKQLGGDPELINPQCPVHLVIDHSIQAEVTKTKNPAALNEKIQFERNQQRFEFLKWGSRAFKNLKIIPPAGGILHQINLEYLSEVVVRRQGLVFPDTVVGTDSHTSMMNGLGVLGWGVGGLEAEAVMLGQPIPILLPKVVGVKLNNKLREGVSAADLVLTLTKQFKNNNVKNKYLQFYGSGVDTLTIPQRATVANMANQYGATVAYFPVDKQTLKYLQQTDRDIKLINLIQICLDSLKIFKTKKSEQLIKYSSTIEVDLQKIQPSVAGPKRPFDWISLNNMKEDWRNSLVGEKGVKQFGVDKQKAYLSHKLKTKKYEQQLKNGSVIIASIDSCTNTVNPKVMIAAGLLAKKAVSKGLRVKKYIKASISPGSLVVSEYLKKSKLIESFNSLGFEIAGYGCMTCIGNSGQIQKQINDLVKKQDLVVCSVTSGNTNYQSKLHRRVKANYLMSPVYVVAYSIAGTVDIDFQTQPIGYSQYSHPIYLRDIFPTDQEVKQIINKSINPQMYSNVYDTIYSGTRRWNSIIIPSSVQYQWKKQSTYIQKPPYLQNITRKPRGIRTIKNAFALAYFGDQITTDLISPSGRILKNSLAGKYLFSKNIERKDFNTYGSRRGNFDVLTRGTFSNPLIINRLSPVIGPKTTFIPTGQVLDFLEASQKYKQLGHQTLIIAGTQYGKGSVKDWAARGPYLLGVRSIIAKTYDQQHRLNLIEMGILPLEFMPQQNAQSLSISGKQTFTINIPEKNLERGQVLTITTNTGKEFQCRSRLDSDLQIEYYRHGGILPYNLRKIKSQSIQ